MTHIILPPSKDPPKYRCRLCGRAFWENRKYEGHVVRCSNRQEDRIHEESLRQRLPGLHHPESGDVEWERWVRENPRKWAKERGIDPDSV